VINVPIVYPWFPFTCPWFICTPTLFRYLPSRYVDAFFEDGSLRLSSFAEFKRHKDEERLDPKEGEVSFFHTTEERGGQTLFARMNHGHDAYVVSAAMRHDKELMRSFGCDSYIRINDPTQFGTLVAQHIPGFRAGAEGPCLYQGMKIMQRDLGYLDSARLSDPKNPDQEDEKVVERLVNEQTKHYPLFMKDQRYAHQVEYRLLWITFSDVEGFLDIKVPEAIPLCSRPDPLTH
jgi:hypothetical protein